MEKSHTLATDLSQNFGPEASSCRHKRRARPYQFQWNNADRLCVVCAITHRRVMYRAGCIALLGAILMLVFQGDVPLVRSVTPLALLKTGLTFVLLYGASTYSTVSSRREC
jgi:hypothetical protein